MANDGTKVAPPPRTLDVHKFAAARASELGSLHSIIADRLNNDFRSRRNKRKRTNGYDDRAGRNKCRKKRRRVGTTDNKTHHSSLQVDQETIPRRVRRRRELQKNPETGYSVSGDGTRRLRTHVWHAKRFRMAKLWGYHLPLGLHGRGKGSRAILKKFKNGVLIHDASYYNVVQLEGPEAPLLSMLRTVLVTSASIYSGDVASSVLSGVAYGSAVLHHAGAPVSEPIAPVTYMWRPSSQQSIHVETDNQGMNQYNEQQETGPSSSSRQLWVWLHASIFSEGYNALTFACQKQNAEAGCLIHCSSLEGQLARLDILGQKAFQLLQKVLRPVALVPENNSLLKRCSVEVQKPFAIENEDNISSHFIISLSVNDPRLSPINASEIVPVEASSNPVKGVLEKETIKCSAFAQSPSNKDSLSSLCFKSESNNIESNNWELWDSGEGIRPPVEESVLCLEKHYKRLDSFCLNYENSELMNSSRKGKCSRLCPLFLLKYSDQKGAPTGWSVILPLSWAKTFWVPLVNNGAHAIGLTEKHWIACEVGLPSFPADFPDCKEYSCFMASQAASFDEKLKLRPPDKRPFRIPIPPPWGSIRLSFESGVAKVGNAFPQLQCPCSEYDIKPLVNSDDMSFEGFIARKADMLTQFLNENHCENLLLFPMQPDKKTSILKFMKNEGKFSPGLDWLAKKTYKRKLCFLRVHVRAWKDGVFEEGAVVCAPHWTDISSFLSRSGDNEGGLQMPQASVQSYFKELPSGKWDFQAPDPDDSAAQKSHRLPIGFVTTGFVQGSKKLVAGAICEATLLARLRAEQWNEMPVGRRREEVYVLVRNLRSTAYRLALATIVLERHEDDVGFL